MTQADFNIKWVTFLKKIVFLRYFIRFEKRNNFVEDFFFNSSHFPTCQNQVLQGETQVMHRKAFFSLEGNG
jgi:hypothetical protein